MWASFPKKCKEAVCVDEETQNECLEGGRGVSILVLGPLAPRTGWIKSDSAGCVISASARIKPNLPVLTFISVDFGGLASWKFFENSSVLFFLDLTLTEYCKDNIIVVGGNLSGDVTKPPAQSNFDFLREKIQSSDVNMSVVSDASTHQNLNSSYVDDVLICQNKKSMTIVNIVNVNAILSDSYHTSSCLVKVSISGWPKKAFAFQLKSKPTPTAGPRRVDNTLRSNQCSRQAMLSDLQSWQGSLRGFSNNLNGILHMNGNVSRSVQSNCLRQLVHDILNRVHKDPTKIDSPGFASTLHLNQLTALLRLSEAEFFSQSTIIVDKAIIDWSAAVSFVINSAES